MAFGKEIKRLRGLANISAKKLADTIGVGAERLRKWEQRDNDPGYEDAKIIEKFFGTTLDKIMKMEKLPVLEQEPKDSKHAKTESINMNKEPLVEYLIKELEKKDEKINELYKRIGYLEKQKAKDEAPSLKRAK